VSGDRGVAVVEFAIVAALLALLATALWPLYALLDTHLDLGRATGAGVRYATKVAPNPCRAGGADCPFSDASGPCAVLRRLPSRVDVEHRVADALGARPDVVVAVSTVPCASRAGTPVTVSAAVAHDLGVLADSVNALAALVGEEPIFPSASISVTATASGLVE
jgi:hypothetical protein